MLMKVLLILISIIFASSVYAKKNNDINVYESIIQRDNIIVGISFDAKPFGFEYPDGQIKGMEADLARKIADNLLGNENNVIFKNVTSQDRIKLVKSGDVDMVISTMTITPQRKKIVYFSIPYFVTGQAICVRKDSKIRSLDDLINKKVIVILGTTGEKNIKRFVPNALIQGYINNSEAINAFKNGSADAITTDDSFLRGLVIENNDYMLLPKKLTKEHYGIAFKKSKQTRTLKKKVNKIINKMKFNGTLRAIKRKWGIN